MSIVGNYTLHLYCDNWEANGGKTDEIHEWREFPHIYIYEKGTTCRRVARKDGWVLNTETGKALCPKCSGKKPK